jgi:serine/threonine protein kinase
MAPGSVTPLATPFTADPAVPERIGTVRVTRTLGKGGMGQVFEGVDEELGRPVAVKVLAEPQEPEAAERFDREAQALARLCHPNVVQVYSKGVFRGHPYFVMELVTGPTVLDVLQQHGPFSVGEALEIARQVINGLNAAADAGVTHRDVKPANLLLASDGTVKVADFGVCKLQGRSAAVTEVGTTLGTPFYMAPEQARGLAVDARADQYSLGATLFHLLSGRTPYAATETVPQLLAHQQEQVPDVRELNAAVPRPVARVLQRMLQKRPEDRFPSYDALQEALEEALAPSRWPPAWRVAALATGFLFAVAAAVAPALWSRSLDLPTLADAPPPRTPRDTVASPPLPSEATRLASSPGDSAPATRPVVAPSRSDDVDDALTTISGPGGPGRAKAMTLLARSGDPRARAGLEQVLKDPADADGPLAAFLLGELADQAATDVLVMALRSPRRATVLASVDALARLRDVRAVTPLDELARTHADPTVRARARKAGSDLFYVEER